MQNLREKLEEERQVVLSREAEKAALEARIDRLTRIVLNSTRALLGTPGGSITRGGSIASGLASPLVSRDVSYSQLKEGGPFNPQQSGGMYLGNSQRSTAASIDSRNNHSGSNRGGGATTLGAGHPSAMAGLSLTSSVRGLGEEEGGSALGAGEIAPGNAVSLYDFESPYVAENEMLREHLRMLTDEMELRGICVAPLDPGEMVRWLALSESGPVLTHAICTALGGWVVALLSLSRR